MIEESEVKLQLALLNILEEIKLREFIYALLLDYALLFLEDTFEV